MITKDELLELRRRVEVGVWHTRHCDQMIELIDAALRSASPAQMEEDSITDKFGVIATLIHKLGVVMVSDHQGNCFGTGPTGLMHLLYRCAEDKQYIPIPPPSSPAGRGEEATCETCGGSGRKPHTVASPCPTCTGRAAAKERT